MSEGFDPFAPVEGAATYSGRPFRASRAARGEAEGDLSEGAGQGSGAGRQRSRPATLPERLLEIEDRLALVEAGLAQLDRKVAARLDEQMARIVLAVADLLGGGMRGRAPDTSSGRRSVRAHGR